MRAETGSSRTRRQGAARAGPGPGGGPDAGALGLDEFQDRTKGKKGEMNRRDFIGGLLATAALPAVADGTDEGGDPSRRAMETFGRLPWGLTPWMENC